MTMGISPPQTIEDYRAALEELEAANEELRRKNEELSACCLATEVGAEKYRRLFELIPDACIVSHTDGVIREANQAALTLFKAVDEPLEGKPLDSFLPEKNRDEFNKRLRQLQAQQEVHAWEEPLLTSDGREFLASFTVRIIHETEGHGIALYWLIRDLTQSREAAKALQESEERYRVIFERSPLGITHFDPDGNVVSCNRQFLNIVGASREKVIGFNMFQSIKDPDMLAAFVKAVSGRIGTYEGNYRSATGDKVTPLRVLYSRVATDEGKLLGTVGIWEDITDRKLAEDALRESEERYRVIFEHSPLGILHFDQKGNIVSCNKQFSKITGGTKEKVIGLNMLQSLRDEAMHAAVVKALSGEIGQYEGEYRSIVSDKLIPLRVLYSRITADDGAPVGAVGIFEDITERKQAEAARRELSRQRLEACNAVAHELRNSLIKIGFVFPAINSVMSFLREQWEMELRKILSDEEDKSTLLLRLGELILMKQSELQDQKELLRLSEELLAEQMVVANVFFLPQHGRAWLDNKIRPKWHRLLAESRAWDAHKDEVLQHLKHLERAIEIVGEEEYAQKLRHIPDDLRALWPRLAYTEFSRANLSFLEEVLHLLDHPELKIKHRQQLSKLLTSLKALADITALVEDRMNRMLLALRSGETFEGD